jgi:hypothetical protein
MHRQGTFWVAVSLCAALGSAPAVGQRTPGARLTAARTALRSLKLDSAARLLRDLLKSADEIPREDRVEAWLLLGIVQFYQGSDSATAADFREALILQPGLRADGLATYDSALVTLFEAQRSGATAARDCSTRGADGVARPRLISFPSFEGLPPDFFDIVHNLDGALTLRFVVDSTGRVVPGTVGVVSSTLKMRELEREILRAFPRARFTAGRADGRSVSVMVQFTLRYAGKRVEDRWDSFCQLVPEH